MHGTAAVRLTSRPMAARENSEDKTNASFLSCSIEEEDFLDDIEPSLVGSTDSRSSHLGSDRFYVSAADAQDASLPQQSPHKAQEPNETRRPINDPVCGHRHRSKLHSSMHDLSKIPSFPLLSKPSNFSSETVQSQSITTVGSCPKSKDSGFPRSLSCLSLNSSGRSYEHVQSKVREYIAQIKAGNRATKRRLTYGTEDGRTAETETHRESTSPLIDRLKEELEEKDRMLAKLQENYDALLMKYAAAENRIDHLRVNSVGNPFNIGPTDYWKPKASPNVLLLPDLRGLRRESNCLDRRPPCEPNRGCVVDRLEEDIVPRLQRSPFEEERNGRYSLRRNFEPEPVKIEPPESPNENQTTAARPLNHKLENPFAKVKRWQESLPCLHLIEPSVYDRFGDTGSELFRHKKIDETVCSLAKGDCLLTSNVNVELSTERHATENRLDETEPICGQESVTSESSDPPPHFNTSPPSDSRLDDDDADLDALKNLIDDLSRHTSHSKDTKNMCRTGDSHSATTSVDNSTTFLCLENASDLSTGDQECARSEYPSVTTSPVTRKRDAASENPPNNTFTTSPARNEPHTSLAAQANGNTQNNVAQNYLPPLVSPLLHKHRLPALPVIRPIATRVSSCVNPDITKETGESDSWCRKRLLGQRARLLLIDYWKLKHSDGIGCTRDGLARSGSTRDSRMRKERGDSFEDKNVSLVKCLDEMNQCAQKLRGKSEAIMEVLARQLRES